jgi:hypothetical protein
VSPTVGRVAAVVEQPMMDVLVMRDLEVRGLGARVERVIEQLRAGDFRSAEVKKLKNAAVYRARLDDRNRLLFRFGEHRGRRVLLVLEVVHNHDYAKARFMGGAWPGEEAFEPVTSVEAAAAGPAERLGYMNPGSPVLHVLDRPMSFDDAQAAVLAAPLPLILIGSAGSGKTALTLEKLKTLPGRGLYLTRSSYLVDSARSLYYAERYANAGQEVDFLSLGELVETIEVPRGRPAGWKDFAAWFERVRGSCKLRDPHRVYEEMRGVLTGTAESAPALGLAEYEALGVRQSIFVGEERREVYRLFERWLAHMRERDLYDENIAAWERRGRAAAIYDFLVIDEIQDITMVELRLALATLRDKECFLLCGDSNQIVHPNLFSWARVKALFHGEREGGERIHILSANYRNTRAVTALANRLLQVKQRRFGSIDRESNRLVDCVSDEAGRVELLADGPRVRAEIDGKTRRSARTAVIVLRDEDKAAARTAFSTPLLFSVQEAKGIEYENVVLYNLVSGAAREFRECVAGVTAADLDGELAYARGRDKTDKSLEVYKFYLNALYVGMTRAVRSLLFVESDPGHPLFELLATERAAESVELAAEESTIEDWQREARRLELQGKAEQAEQIRRDILGARAVPWPVADSASLPEIRRRALGEGPRDKAAQQLLFEHALTCYAPSIISELAAAGFRHAKRPDSGLSYIEETHYAEYQYRRSQVVASQIRAHGIDFRNPLNETPLMVAARLGRAEMVADLLARGADPDLCDTAGRTALRVAIASWLDGRGIKPAELSAVYQHLATAPIKVKVGGRMVKLDPSSMEWFLLHLVLVLSRRLAANALPERAYPAFNAPILAAVLASFPPAVLPEHRRRRAYVSSILSKNEVTGRNPYNRGLFLRVGHGYYLVNPALEIEVRGAWVGVAELMGLPALFDTVGSGADYLRRWLSSLEGRLARQLQAPVAGAGAAAPTG